MSYSVNGDPPLVFCDRGFSMFGIGTGRKPDLPHLHCQTHDTMPSSPPGNSAPSRVVQALDRALDQSHDVKAEVEACAADLGAANELAQAQISHGTTMLPAAQALENGLAIEQRVQGCADDLQQVTVDLARGLDEVRAVEQALERSRAALATSEAALAEHRTGQRQSTLRDTASEFDDAPAGAWPTRGRRARRARAAPAPAAGPTGSRRTRTATPPGGRAAAGRPDRRARRRPGPAP